MHRLKFFRTKTEIPAKSGRKRGPRRNRVCSGSIGKNVTEHRGDRSVSRSDCKPRRKIGESRPKSWMDVIPVRVGQASSRGQCLTSSVKLRDLDDHWGRNGEGGGESIERISIRATLRPIVRTMESIFKFSFFPLRGKRI